MSPYLYAANCPILCLDSDGNGFEIYLQVGNNTYFKIPVLMDIDEKGNITNIRLDYANGIRTSGFGKENKINSNALTSIEELEISNYFNVVKIVIECLSEEELGKDLLKRMNVHSSGIRIEISDEIRSGYASETDQIGKNDLNAQGFPKEQTIIPDFKVEDFNTP